MVIEFLQHCVKLKQSVSPSKFSALLPQSFLAGQVQQFAGSLHGHHGVGALHPERLVLDVKQDTLEPACAVLLFLEVTFSNCRFF